MSKNKFEPSGQTKEVPFWRDGMSFDEYEEERMYLFKCMKNDNMDDYKPLWKQKESNE